MRYTDDQLTEAKRQIDSTLHKLRESLKTLEGKENPQPIQVADNLGSQKDRGVRYSRRFDRERA